MQSITTLNSSKTDSERAVQTRAKELAFDFMLLRRFIGVFTFWIEIRLAL